MSAAVGRAMGIIELLVKWPDGLPLGEIAKRLDVPPSATHRLLNELVGLGYLRHNAALGSYAPSMKLISLSLEYLSQVDVVEMAKPAIDRLARESGALARLGIVDERELIWVIKSQGSRSNIRYDPPMNYRVRLSCSAGGHAWLSQLTDEQALELVFRQGLGTREEYGPLAPVTAEEILAALRTARERGYAQVTDTYERGVTAVAVPIVNAEFQRVTGILSIAGPNSDMDPEHVQRMVPLLKEEARNLATARIDFARYVSPPRHAAVSGDA